MDHHHCRACGGLCKVHNHQLVSEILRRQFAIEKLFKETVILMSEATLAAQAVKVATDAVNANLTVIQDSLIALNDDVVKLQAVGLTTAGGGGILDAATQALLDGIVARSASLARMAQEDLAQRFPPAPPVASAPVAATPTSPVTASGDRPNVAPVVTEVSAPPAMAGSVPAPRTSTPDGSAPVAPPPFVMGTPAVAPTGNVPPAAPTKPAGK